MFSVWYMFVRLRINILLSKAKVYNMYDVLLSRGIAAYQEILWLHIPVD